MGKGSKSVVLRWLDEVGGEGSGIYEYDAAYTKTESIGFGNVCSANAELHPCLGLSGQKQWLTAEALEAAEASASAASFALPAVSAATPASSSATSAANSSATSSTSVAATPAASTAADGTRGRPINLDPDTIIMRCTTRGKHHISSSTLLSSDEMEYLNDSQVGAAGEIMEQPTQRRIKLMYPRASAPERIFQRRSVLRALTGAHAEPLAAVVQSYVSSVHWRKLIICFDEKLVYYVEPFGSRLLSSHAIVKAFDHAFASLNDGWRFECIEAKLQTDSH